MVNYPQILRVGVIIRFPFRQEVDKFSMNVSIINLGKTRGESTKDETKKGTQCCEKIGYRQGRCYETHQLMIDLVISKFGEHNRSEKVAMHWVAMTTPYNTILMINLFN